MSSKIFCICKIILEPYLLNILSWRVVTNKVDLHNRGVEVGSNTCEICGFNDRRC